MDPRPRAREGAGENEDGLKVGRTLKSTEAGAGWQWGTAGLPGLGTRAIPTRALLTLPVAQGLGAQRQPRRRQRRLQQEQAGPRHQQREQGGEERGGGHFGT